MIEELKKDKEESSNENENEKEKDKSTKNSSIPEGSYSTVGDLNDYITTPMDRKLAEVFDGEYIRANDGTQLDGGIVDDNLWQVNYPRIIIYPLSQYDLPSGPVGRLFVHLFSAEIDGVRERKWNMEKVLCYMSMILHTSPDVKRTSNIRKRINNRITDWIDKKFQMLASSTVLYAEAQMNRKRGIVTIKEKAKIFSALKMRAATRNASEQGKGGILIPGDVDEKTGDLVSETLESKHPVGRDVKISRLPIFESCPELINIEITEDNVEKVAKRLSG